MEVIPKYKFVETSRPPCSKCRRPLMLARIEPEEPGFDLQIYYCAHCAATETMIAAISAGESQGEREHLAPSEPDKADT